MSHYLDIHLRPDPEFPAHHLMEALYAKLHRAMVQLQTSTMAVSFPGYSRSPARLGNTLRLIASAADLRHVMELDWLKGMREHVDISPTAAVPATAGHCALRRVQAKSSPLRLQRRQMRRHGLTAEQARERIPESAVERLDLPFIQLSSASTGQRFRLYLKLDSNASASTEGTFNTYGLSSTATTPWF